MTDVPRSDESGSSGDVGGDEDLLDELRALDHVPENIRLAAKESLAARSPVGTEFAKLVHDSALDEKSVADLETGSRVLRFGAPQLTIEIAVSDAPGGLRITGQLTPARTTNVECRHAHGVTETKTDAHGRFTLEGISGGAVSLRCRFSGNEIVAVQTDWVTLLPRAG